MNDTSKHDKHRDNGRHDGERDAPSSVRNTAARVYESTVEKASQTLETSRDLAADAARRTAAGINSNPLGVVVGGLAVGVIAGALLPRSDREKELLAPLGAQIGERARGAIAAAKEVGMSELEDLGLSREAAKDQARKLFDGVVKAATAAGQAAAKSASGGDQPA